MFEYHVYTMLLNGKMINMLQEYVVEHVACKDGH